MGSGSPGTWGGLGKSRGPVRPEPPFLVGSRRGALLRAALPSPRRKVPMFGLEAVWRDGKVVGHIRRADFGFAIDKTIAYGYIRDPAGGPVSTDALPPPAPRGRGLPGRGSVALVWF